LRHRLHHPERHFVCVLRVKWRKRQLMSIRKKHTKWHWGWHIPWHAHEIIL